MTNTASVRWHPQPDEASLNAFIAQQIAALATQCIVQKKAFHIVLAGGNTPRKIYTALRTIKTDWSCWHIYFGDERCVPMDSTERNDNMASEAWLSHVAIPKAQIHRMRVGELSASDAAAQYTKTLHEVGTFDLVLLGVGEDGHTASLFPNHKWGETDDAPSVLFVEHAPFAPQQRITLSAQRLSNTQHLWYVVSGNKKTNALQRWQQGEYLPMTVIQPKNGVDVFVAP